MIKLLVLIVVGWVLLAVAFAVALCAILAWMERTWDEPTW